jgi:hypothetical protein
MLRTADCHGWILWLALIGTHGNGQRLTKLSALIIEGDYAHRANRLLHHHRCIEPVPWCGGDDLRALNNRPGGYLRRAIPDRVHRGDTVGDLRGRGRLVTLMRGPSIPRGPIGVVAGWYIGIKNQLPVGIKLGKAPGRSPAQLGRAKADKRLLGIKLGKAPGRSPADEGVTVIQPLRIAL